MTATVTDRALRYRAVNLIPDHPQVCAFCGATPRSTPMLVGHVDGREENFEADNLTWTCRSCNSIASNTLQNAGMGRRTRQFNPTKSGGASNIGEWMQAVGAITPHTDRGDRGLVSSMSVSEAVAMIRATPHSKRSEFASRLRRRNPMKKQNLFGFGTPKALGARQTTPARGGIAAHSKGASRSTRSSAGSVGTHKGYSISRDSEGEFYSSLDPSSRFGTKAAAEKHIDWYLKGRGNPSRFDKCVASVSARGGAVDPRAVCAAAGRKKYGQKEMTRRAVAGKRKKNPAAGADAVYEEFHGRPSDETVTVKRDVHFHRNLAGLGELRRLVVIGVDEQVHNVTGFRGALLCANEDKNQLFIEGGDQAIDLSDFGIVNPQERVTLGKVWKISYHTTKDHLGDEGGEAVYEHEFGTTNENGRHVKVKGARLPDLIYMVRDEALEFSGGSYEIRAEGIDK